MGKLCNNVYYQVIIAINGSLCCRVARRIPGAAFYGLKGKEYATRQTI